MGYAVFIPKHFTFSHGGAERARPCFASEIRRVQGVVAVDNISFSLEQLYMVIVNFGNHVLIVSGKETCDFRLFAYHPGAKVEALINSRGILEIPCNFLVHTH